MGSASCRKVNKNFTSASCFNRKTAKKNQKKRGVNISKSFRPLKDVKMKYTRLLHGVVGVCCAPWLRGHVKANPTRAASGVYTTCQTLISLRSMEVATRGKLTRARSVPRHPKAIKTPVRGWHVVNCYNGETASLRLESIYRVRTRRDLLLSKQTAPLGSVTEVRKLHSESGWHL